MDHEDNQYNDPNNRISLDLSLRIGPQEQHPVEKQVLVEEQDPIEEQGHFMQLLRSVSDPPPTTQPSTPPKHYMMPHEIYAWNVSGVAFPPSPLPPLGQLLQPQAIQGGSETPRTGTRLGRPPSGPQARRNSSRVAVERNVGDKEIVPVQPYPAIIHTLSDLLTNNITVISGQVYCRPCEKTETLEYNLKEKFEELERYIKENKEVMRQRAPSVWMYPKLIRCGLCDNEMKPVISLNKEEINWLFLLLGQMLGCCTLEQLKYYCHKTSQHRTGSKDRILYSTYLGLCMQLKHCNTFSL
ncbi:unnamed protein product [Thlaspi arvense]|uniref:DUF7086 domain-containing protein n=1 Tax=Thlaspi arvense TaxID=13288 RepID=A0AAU9RTA7_THLAR|nr:unnamed protein product [Thlaspi arvense]